jgi:hypothetical protein
MEKFRIYVEKLVRFDGYIDVTAENSMEAFNSVYEKIRVGKIIADDVKNWDYAGVAEFDVTEDVDDLD